MILWSIQLILLYLLLIVLVHYLYSFFKITLTIPKMKDLVNKPVERYNEIYTTISDNKKTNLNLTIQNNANEMQSELKDFLQHLHTNDTSIESSPSTFNDFSTY